MTENTDTLREHQLSYCKKCEHRMVRAKDGFYCGLTDELACFTTECSDFILDKTSPFYLKESPDHDYETIGSRRERMMDQFREYQNIPMAVISGLFAALVCAIIWAGITVATGMQFGLTVLGVGLVVGYAVQYFGSGVDPIFGIIGGLMALLGCLLGNFFSLVGFAADGATNYFQILSMLNFTDITSAMAETFSIMDLLFYGLAIAEGIKFGVLRYSNTELKAMSDVEFNEPSQNFNLRKYFNVGFLILLMLFVFKVTTGNECSQSFYNEDGSLASQGEFVDGAEQGEWTYYTEAGKVMSVGDYKKGIRHGKWTWFYYNGVKESQVVFKDGEKEGVQTFWAINGDIVKEEIYLKGELQSTEEFVVD